MLALQNITLGALFKMFYRFLIFKNLWKILNFPQIFLAYSSIIVLFLCIYYTQVAHPWHSISAYLDYTDADGYLFNDSRAYMRLTSQDLSIAVVKLPPDVEYQEPGVQSSWYGVSVLHSIECVYFRQELSTRVLSVWEPVYPYLIP